MSSGPSLVKQAYRAIEELQARLAGEEQARHEPIAVIGIGCRLPGGAHDAEAFWRLLLAGTDAVREVPSDRWDVEAYYDPDPETPGRMTTRSAGFLSDVDVRAFDAAFFGITPREATAMDPQQRLMLEVAYEALEDAGLPLESVAGTPTGVFVGISGNEYGQMGLDAGGLEVIDPYSGTGNVASVAAGRLSYVFGLHGPNFPIDTACSSSLVATHLAVRSLRAGECRLALVGGVNLILAPAASVYFSKLRATSPDGRCKTFDARADGYGRGEGCGVVVLKRLADAIADGDRILAAIRGTAVNHDGRSNGLTAPHGPSQEAVIRAALADGRLAPADVGCIEAHGTGTPLGDPIEIASIRATYGSVRRERPLAIGSVKTNIGHLEAAAGVAGLIKAVLAVRHGIVPPHLHLRQLNPYIRLDDVPAVVPDRPQAWETPGPRRTAISSFGFSGTNAHAIVESYDEAPASAGEEGPRLLPLSAKTPQALSALIGAWRTFASDAEGGASIPLGDAAWTASRGRSHYAHRLAFVASTWTELRAALASADASARPNVASPGRLAFVFAGQGSTWPGMARGLRREPAFREAFDACDAALGAAAGLSLVDEVEAGGPRLHETAVAQPVLAAFGIALAALWRSWGIEPDVVAGHSVGEIAAAHVAGVLTLEEAMRLAAVRGRLMEALRGGRMCSVALAAAEAAAVATASGGRLTLAAVNDDRRSVLAGDAEALDGVVAALTARGVEVRALDVAYAFHGPGAEAIGGELEQALAGLRPAAPRVPLVSTLTGGRLDREAMGPAYWRRQLAGTVRFADAVAALAADGVTAVVELAPRPTLAGALRRGLEKGGVAAPVVVSPLGEGDDERVALLRGLGRLYESGRRVEWSGVSPVGRRVRLPGYPWQRERFWVDAGMPRSRTAASGVLGAPVFPADRPGTVVFDGRLDARSAGSLADHRVFGRPVMPAAAFIDLALLAAEKAYGASPRRVNGIGFRALLGLGTSHDLQVILDATGDGGSRFRIFARAADAASGTWRLHAEGALEDRSAAPEPSESAAAVEARCTQRTDVPALYASLASAGLDYGPAFRGIAEMKSGADEAWARLVLARQARGEARRHVVHPALLDAAFQTVGALSVETDGRGRIPAGLARFELFRAPGRGDVFAHVRREGTNAAVRLFDAAGCWAEAAGFEAADIESGLAAARHLYQPVWRAQPRAPRTTNGSAPRVRLISLRSDAFAGSLAAALEARGAEIGGDEPRDVILLAALDGAGDVSLERAAELVEHGVRLARMQVPQASRLTFVTRHAQPAPGAAVRDVAGAALWGLGAVLATEHPRLTGRRIDVGSERDAGALADEILSGSDEDRVALRGAERFVERLVPRTPEVLGGALRPAPDAVYVITGGLGALGLETARRLVERGARRIVLSGRQAAPERVREAESRLAPFGASVRVVTADVAAAGDVERLAAEARAWGPVRGVVHAAGVLEDGLIETLDLASLRRVLAPKLGGALNLARAFGERLELLAFYSSAAALLGSPGQAAYAAANAALDGLASSLRARGIPAVSVQWGPWAEVGMAARTVSTASRLLPAIPIAAALDAFEHAAAGSDARVAVLAPLPEGADAALGGRPLVAELSGVRAPEGPSLRDRLAAAPPEDQAALVEEWLREGLAAASGAAVGSVPVAAPLQQLGIDSLMALDLRNRIESALGIALPVVAILGGATLHDLTKDVLERFTISRLQDAPAAGYEELEL